MPLPGELEAALLERLRPLIVHGEEDEKLDFKREVELQTRPGKAAMAKDIAAMANVPPMPNLRGGPSYILIGVTDPKHRADNSASECFAGLPAGWPSRDSVAQTLHQLVRDFLSPPPRIRYTQVTEPETGREVGILTIFQSQARPHSISRQGEGIELNQNWIRRGSHAELASREELEEMFRARRSGQGITVLNFHHPITQEVLDRYCADADCRVDAVIEVPVQLDDEQPFEDQVRRIVDFAGLTSEEWQTLRLAVMLPGYAPAAAVLLAELHGRMGHFPTVLRQRPVQQGSPTQFAFAEAINLQEIRSRSRCAR